MFVSEWVDGRIKSDPEEGFEGTRNVCNINGKTWFIHKLKLVLESSIH
jgi:hypothetical protein